MNRPAINWTSTDVPMWESDCIQFWRTGLPFELRNVSTAEHEQFVSAFAATHQLTVTRENRNVVFQFESAAGARNSN